MEWFIYIYIFFCFFFYFFCIFLVFFILFILNSYKFTRLIVNLFQLLLCKWNSTPWTRENKFFIQIIIPTREIMHKIPNNLPNPHSYIVRNIQTWNKFPCPVMKVWSWRTTQNIPMSQFTDMNFAFADKIFN